MEPFKNLINAQTARDAAHHVARAWPAFPRKSFEALALAGLEALELKARVLHLSLALDRSSVCRQTSLSFDDAGLA